MARTRARCFSPLTAAAGRPGSALATCACGEAAVIAAMTAAKAMGAVRGRVVSYANSGDAPVGQPERAVGYGAVAFSAGEPGADLAALAEPPPPAELPEEVIRLAVRGDLPDPETGDRAVEVSMKWESGARKFLGSEIRSTLYSEKPGAEGTGGRVVTWRPDASFSARSAAPRSTCAPMTPLFALRPTSTFTPGTPRFISVWLVVVPVLVAADGSGLSVVGACCAWAAMANSEAAAMRVIFFMVQSLD